jgi:hypothetical protein
MASTVYVYVEDLATVMATYTQVRVYRDTSPGGAFTTQVSGSPVTLVAGTLTYPVTDSTGTPNRWYRYRYYNPSTVVQSELSDPFQAVGTSLEWLRIETARRAGSGFESLATGGDTTTLIDAQLADSAVDEHYLEGGWVYRPDAADAGDMVRRVALSGYDPATQELTFARAYANAPVDGERYQVFLLLPPVDHPASAFSWDRAVRDGLLRCPYVDEVVIGQGGTGNRFTLAQLAGLIQRESVRRVFVRRTDDDGNRTEWTFGQQGTWWEWEENGPGNMAITVHGYWPVEGETVLVEVLRRENALYVDTDVTLVNIERAARAGAYEAFRWLNAVAQPGRYAVEEDRALANWLHEERLHRPPPVVLGV